MSETKTESTGAKGVTTGCLAGSGMGCLMVVGGALLSMTGIGAIIGIPMIVLGLGAPIMGMGMGQTEVKGPCPWCGTEVVASAVHKGTDCPACKKRIVIRDKRFVKVE